MTTGKTVAIVVGGLVVGYIIVNHFQTAAKPAAPKGTNLGSPTDLASVSGLLAPIFSLFNTAGHSAPGPNQYGGAASGQAAGAVQRTFFPAPDVYTGAPTVYDSGGNAEPAGTFGPSAPLLGDGGGDGLMSPTEF